MRKYMASGLDASEGAILVFANTSKEAKKISVPVLDSWGITFTDIRVIFLKHHEYLNQYSKGDFPHVIDSPEVCKSCELWGISELVNGLCEACSE